MKKYAYPIPPNALFERYFEDTADFGRPTAVADLSFGNYVLYLYAPIVGDWYVVVDSDYLFLDSIPKDVQNKFPVSVEGWCVLKKFQSKTKLLPPMLMAGNVHDSDENWITYRSIVADDLGTNFVLLKVTPLKGITSQTIHEILPYIQETEVAE